MRVQPLPQGREWDRMEVGSAGKATDHEARERLGPNQKAKLGVDEAKGSESSAAAESKFWATGFRVQGSAARSEKGEGHFWVRGRFGAGLGFGQGLYPWEPKQGDVSGTERSLGSGGEDRTGRKAGGRGLPGKALPGWAFEKGSAQGLVLYRLPEPSEVLGVPSASKIGESVKPHQAYLPALSFSGHGRQGHDDASSSSAHEAQTNGDLLPPTTRTGRLCHDLESPTDHWLRFHADSSSSSAPGRQDCDAHSPREPGRQSHEEASSACDNGRQAHDDTRLAMDRRPGGAAGLVRRCASWAGSPPLVGYARAALQKREWDCRSEGAEDLRDDADGGWGDVEAAGRGGRMAGDAVREGEVQGEGGDVARAGGVQEGLEEEGDAVRGGMGGRPRRGVCSEEEAADSSVEAAGELSETRSESVPTFPGSGAARAEEGRLGSGSERGSETGAEEAEGREGGEGRRGADVGSSVRGGEGAANTDSFRIGGGAEGAEGDREEWERFEVRKEVRNRSGEGLPEEGEKPTVRRGEGDGREGSLESQRSSDTAPGGSSAERNGSCSEGRTGHQGQEGPLGEGQRGRSGCLVERERLRTGAEGLTPDGMRVNLSTAELIASVLRNRDNAATEWREGQEEGKQVASISPNGRKDSANKDKGLWQPQVVRIMIAPSQDNIPFRGTGAPVGRNWLLAQILPDGRLLLVPRNQPNCPVSSNQPLLPFGGMVPFRGMGPVKTPGAWFPLTGSEAGPGVSPVPVRGFNGVQGSDPVPACGYTAPDFEPLPKDGQKNASREKVLVEKLTSGDRIQVGRAVEELQTLTLEGPQARALLVEAGAIPALLGLLRPDPDTRTLTLTLMSTPTLERAMVALRQLSREEPQKALTEIDALMGEGLPLLIEVLRSGTVAARQNAAGVLFSLAKADQRRMEIGRLGAIPPLVHLLTDSVPPSAVDAKSPARDSPPFLSSLAASPSSSPPSSFHSAFASPAPSTLPPASESSDDSCDFRVRVGVSFRVGVPPSAVPNAEGCPPPFRQNWAAPPPLPCRGIRVSPPLLERVRVSSTPPTPPPSMQHDPPPALAVRFPPKSPNGGNLTPVPFNLGEDRDDSGRHVTARSSFVGQVDQWGGWGGGGGGGGGWGQSGHSDGSDLRSDWKSRGGEWDEGANRTRLKSRRDAAGAGWAVERSDLIRSGSSDLDEGHRRVDFHRRNSGAAEGSVGPSNPCPAERFPFRETAERRPGGSPSPPPRALLTGAGHPTVTLSGRGEGRGEVSRLASGGGGLWEGGRSPPWGVGQFAGGRTPFPSREVYPPPPPVARSEREERERGPFFPLTASAAGTPPPTEVLSLGNRATSEGSPEEGSNEGSWASGRERRGKKGGKRRGVGAERGEGAGEKGGPSPLWPSIWRSPTPNPSREAEGGARLAPTPSTKPNSEDERECADFDSERRWAARALYYLAIYRPNKTKIIQAGAIPILLALLQYDLQSSVVNDAVRLLASLVLCEEGRETLTLILEERDGADLSSFLEVLEGGSPQGKESVAAALLSLAEWKEVWRNRLVEEGALCCLGALAQMGTPRAKQKAQQLLSLLRHRSGRPPPRGK